MFSDLANEVYYLLSWKRLNTDSPTPFYFEYGSSSLALLQTKNFFLFWVYGQFPSVNWPIRKGGINILHSVMGLDNNNQGFWPQ